MSNATSYAPKITSVEPHEKSIEVIRSALIEVQGYIKTREPEHDGDALDKVITWRDAVNAGLAQYSLGSPGGVGPGGGEFQPPPNGGLAGWDDLTPPDTLDNLVVTSIPTGFFVQFDAPTYRQGGGNAYSIIYQANWDGVSPLPTFADSVPVGTVTERNVILVIAAEPGVQGHFWAQPVSHAEDYNNIAPQTASTGGLHGEYTTAGQLSDDHIADLSAGKITAGQIAVGEYIESTGYDPGVYGWHIGGNGNAEFNNVVVRGTIYATAGLIGGAVIDADGVESDNYVAATSGWRLDNTTGTLYAYDGEFGGDLKANDGTLGSLVIAAGGHIRQGQTAYATGTGFFLGDASGTTKFSIGSATKYMRWDGTDLLLSNDVEWDTFSASIGVGDISVDQPSLGEFAVASRTVTPSGGKAPYQYSWVMQETSRTIYYVATSAFISAGAGTATVTVRASGTTSGTAGPPHAYRTWRLIAFVTDDNGRTTSAAVDVLIGFYTDTGGGD